MRGTFSPVSDHYSDELRQIILSMLHLDPHRRPNINQIMAQPIVLNALMNLYTDFGKVPCRRLVMNFGGKQKYRDQLADDKNKEHTLALFVVLEFQDHCLPFRGLVGHEFIELHLAEVSVNPV